MRIHPGQKAPEFEVTDIHGKTIKLDELKGKKILVSFFRYASCPLCNLRVHQLIQNYERWKTQGFEIISFFQSPKESMEQYVAKQELPFPLIPEPKRETYKKYGVESSFFGFLKGGFQLKKFFAAAALGFKPGKMEGDVTILPADFLINENGAVVKAFYAEDISEHLPLKEIEAFIAGSTSQ